MVDDIIIHGSGADILQGHYERTWTCGPGVMFCRYQKGMIERRNKAVIKSKDIFGNKWQISVITIGDGGEEERSRVYYTWQSVYGSIVPPKYGWQPVDEESAPAPRLDYCLRR